MEVHVNSIGSESIRLTYLEKLRNALSKYIKELCNTCKIRLEKNALRVFDCKKSNCKEILEEKAPYIFDSITSEDRQHFEIMTRMLNEMNIPYKHDNRLVRGLDYYSHTTFEITSSALGSQDALCGGGRYNGLIEQLGGKSTPAVGFAAGVERLILAIGDIKELESSPDIYIITIGEEAIVQACRIAQDLRIKCRKKVILETIRRSMKAQMRDANRCGAEQVIILGNEELQENKVLVKKMSTGVQEQISLDSIVEYFDKNL